MKQVQERGTKADIAQDMLAGQLYLPSATLKELGGWLRSVDSFLFTRASNIFGKRLSLPKEIINVALDLLANDSTFSKGKDILKNCRTLHHEAIAKLLDLFRKAGSENVAALDHVPVSSISMKSILQKHKSVAFMLRRQILQPDDVKALKTTLQQSMPNKGQFIYLLGMTTLMFSHNVNTPQNILKLLVHLLKPTQIGNDLFTLAQFIFQCQSHLSAEVIQELRDIFNHHPWEIISVLSGRVNLLCEAVPFVKKQITLGVVNAGHVRIAISSLLGQSDLSDDIMTWLLRNLSADSRKVVELISQQRYLSKEFISACFKPGVLGSIVYNRQEFIEPFLTRMERGEDDMVTNAAHAWGSYNLGAESISRLVALLAVKPPSELAARKSQAAAMILAQQDQLPVVIIPTLFQIANEDISLLFCLWDNQPTALFYTHLEIICNVTEIFILGSILSGILIGYINESNSLIWIDGGTISFYLSDGEISSLRLKDERRFRTKFREA